MYVYEKVILRGWMDRICADRISAKSENTKSVKKHYAISHVISKKDTEQNNIETWTKRTPPRVEGAGEILPFQRLLLFLD